MYKDLRIWIQYILEIYPDGFLNSLITQESYHTFIHTGVWDECLCCEYEVLSSCMDDFECEIGMCGCGKSGYTNKVIIDILNSAKDRKLFWEKFALKDYIGLIQFVLYVLNDKDFLEHGSSISSCWLTKKGELYLHILTRFEQLNKDEESEICT